MNLEGPVGRRVLVGGPGTDRRRPGSWDRGSPGCRTGGRPDPGRVRDGAGSSQPGWLGTASGKRPQRHLLVSSNFMSPQELGNGDPLVVSIIRYKSKTKGCQPQPPLPLCEGGQVEII
jgi:hypothetical protein